MRPRRTVLPASWSSRSVASVDTTSCQIADDARAEIASDPHIPHPAEIAVSTDDAAWAAPGVRAVEDQIVIDY
jgi:hypothetical protein